MNVHTLVIMAMCYIDDRYTMYTGKTRCLTYDSKSVYWTSFILCLLLIKLQYYYPGYKYHYALYCINNSKNYNTAAEPQLV